MRLLFNSLAKSSWFDFFFARYLACHPKLFREFVYTDAQEALRILEKRRADQALATLISSELKGDIPDPLTRGPRSILFRQIATPNFETRLFLERVAEEQAPAPLLWEYIRDKFTNHNEYKHSLCKMLFWSGQGKKGGHKIARKTIIDFNKNNGLKLQDIVTLSGERLTAFHHWLFGATYHTLSEDSFFDASLWFSKHGKRANNYYEPFIMLFVRDAILFENFLLTKQEKIFTQKIFLPAFLKAYRKTGHKPLIVPLVPLESEENTLWYAHPAESADPVAQRAMSSVVS